MFKKFRFFFKLIFTFVIGSFDLEKQHFKYTFLKIFKLNFGVNISF